MANTFNRVFLLGNLVFEPELKKTSSDFSVCENRLAVKRQFVKQGEPDADFFNITLMKRDAEFLCRYFHKGDRILVVGEIRNEEYIDKEGNRRFTTKIYVKEVVSFKERNASDQSGSNDAETYDAPLYAKTAAPTFEQLKHDDDLPF